MAIQLGSAYGKVSIDASGVKSGVSQAKNSLLELGTTLKSFGRDLQFLGAGMTAAISVPLLLVGKSALTAATDLNDAKEKTALVFGDMTDSVLTWSKTTAMALGQSQRQALDGAAAFGLLFTQMGVGKSAAAGMSEKLVALATDISEFNGDGVETVLEQLQSGLVGRGMELKKLGVDLADATVRAKAMAMGLADANGVVSEGAMVQARYALILEGTAKVQGLFAGKTNDMSKSAAQNKAIMENLLATFGERFMPIAIKVVDAVNRILLGFTNLPEPIQDAILVLGGLAIIAGPLVGIFGTIMSIGASFVTIAGALSGLGISLGAVAAAIGTVVGVLATVVLPILIIIGTLALLYLAFKNNFGGIRTAAEQLWFILKYKFSEGWNNISNSTKEGMANMGASIQSGTEGARNIFSGFINWIQGAWRSLVQTMGMYAAAARNWIISAFNVNWGQIGSNIINGIINGFLSGIGALIAAAQSAAQAILHAFDTILDSHSPSREMFKRGLWSTQGYLGGMNAGMDPREIAKILARPVQNIGGNQAQYLTQNFYPGVSMRQVQGVVAENNDQMMEAISRMLGG